MAKRLSVNLSDEVADLLKDLAESRGVTVTEVIRSAISTEHFLDEQISNDNKILLENKQSGQVRELVWTHSKSRVSS